MIIFRLIGRIAFPIFCFLLIQGYLHTKDDKKRLLKYWARLLMFAIISEIPFNLLNSGKISNIYYQNVFFTLFLGLSSLCVFEYLKPHSKILSILSIVCINLFAVALRTDYCMLMMLFIYSIYFYVKSQKESILWISFSCIAVLEVIEYIPWNDISVLSILPIYWGILLAIPFISNYNGQLGKKSKFLKYLFYSYYPLHLMVLYWISIFCGGH